MTYVILKSLRFKLYKKCSTVHFFYKKWQSKLLVVELESKKRDELGLSTELVAAEQRMRSTFSFLDASVVFRQVFTVTEVSGGRHCAPMRTFRAWHRQWCTRWCRPLNPDKVVYNFSSATIPTRVKIFLAFGLDFCLPVYRIDFYRYFLSFEKLILSLKTNKLPIRNSKINFDH